VFFLYEFPWQQLRLPEVLPQALLLGVCQQEGEGMSNASVLAWRLDRYVTVQDVFLGVETLFPEEIAATQADREIVTLSKDTGQAIFSGNVEVAGYPLRSITILQVAPFSRVSLLVQYNMTLRRDVSVPDIVPRCESAVGELSQALFAGK
jgi:hypothetical protein